MPISAPGLILVSNSDVKVAKVTIQNEAQGVQISDIQKYLKKKTTPQVLGTYPWKGQTLHLIGYKEGKAGTENKHELPPPLDNQLFFGDILVFLTKDKKSFSKPIPFKPEEYETFYTNMFEGFDDLGEEEDEEEEEEEIFEEDMEEEFNNEEELEEKFGDEEEETEDIVEEQDEEVHERRPKQEEEEDEIENRILLPKKKTTSKLSKAKSKQSKETNLHLGEAELDPEQEVPSKAPEQPNRVRVFEIAKKYLQGKLSNSQIIELEHVLFNSSLIMAKKKHIQANWYQPLFIEVYNALARNIIGNLQSTNYIQNEGLLKRIQEGKINISELGNYSFSDLYPEIWKDLSIRQFEREKRQLEGNRSMATDRFQCKGCGKRECVYYELQTRSADEPMTIFINCVNCGKHWRQ